VLKRPLTESFEIILKKRESELAGIKFGLIFAVPFEEKRKQKVERKGVQCECEGV